MADRFDYYKQLADAKTNAVQSNGVLVNPTNASTQVGNDIETTNKKVNSTGNKSAWYDKIFGFIDDVAREFGSGFVRGWEGIGDFLLTGVSAIGEAFGNDMTALNDYIGMDLGGMAGQWTQSYMNFTPWGIFKNIQNYGDSEYWKNLGEDSLTNLSYAFGNFLGKSKEDYNKIYENNQRYGINNSVTLNDMGGTGEFIGGIAGSIGEMLPSIMIGNAVGGAMASAKGVASVAELSKAGQMAVQGVQLGAFGLGAGGNASAQALNEGATAGQALGYGAVSGAIEAGTELASMGISKGLGNIVAKNPALKNMLSHTSKIGGWDILHKSIGTMSIKELAGNMVEEGLEEVASELLSPLAKMIYDKGALKEYSTADYWKGVGLSFASGAVMGGVMEGANSIYFKTALGKNGVEAYNNVRQMDETQKAVFEKLKNGEITYEQAEADLQANAQLIKDTMDLIDGLSERQKENFIKTIISPEQAIKEFKQDKELLFNNIDAKTEKAYTKDFLSKYYKDERTMQALEARLSTWYNDLDASMVYYGEQLFEGKGVEGIEFKNKLTNEKGEDIHAYFDAETKKIVVNSKYRSQYIQALAHEGYVHALHSYSPEAFKTLKDFLLTEDGQKEYNKIMRNPNIKKDIWGTNLKGKTLEEVVEKTYSKQGSRVIEEEKLAHFLQEYIKNGRQLEDLMKGNKNQGVLTRFFKKVFKNLEKTGDSKLLRQLKQVVNNVDNAKAQNTTSGKRYSSYLVTDDAMKKREQKILHTHRDSVMLNSQSKMFYKQLQNVLENTTEQNSGGAVVLENFEKNVASFKTLIGNTKIDSSLPVVITRKHLRNIQAEDAIGGGHAHNLDANTIQTVIQNYDKPTAVYKVSGDKYLTIYFVEGRTNPIISALATNRSDKFGNQVHYVESIYERENVFNDDGTMTKSGREFFYNLERNLIYLEEGIKKDARLPRSYIELTDIASTYNIANDNYVVNPTFYGFSLEPVKITLARQGSKRTLLKAIAPYMPPQRAVNRYFDVFGGSATMTINANYVSRFLNEFDTTQYNQIKLFKEHDPQYVIQQVRKIVDKYEINKTNTYDKFKKLKDAYNNNTLYGANRDVALYVLKSLSFSPYLNNVGNNGKYSGGYGGSKQFNQFLNSLSNGELYKLAKNTYDGLQRKVTLSQKDALDIINKSTEGDFLYLDPPYILTNAEYNKMWTEEKDQQLRDALVEANKRGVMFALSNAFEYTTKKGEHKIAKEWIEWAKQFNLYEVEEKKYGKAIAREVLVTNYKPFDNEVKYDDERIKYSKTLKVEDSVDSKNEIQGDLTEQDKAIIEAQKKAKSIERINKIYTQTANDFAEYVGYQKNSKGKKDLNSNDILYAKIVKTSEETLKNNPKAKPFTVYFKDKGMAYATFEELMNRFENPDDTRVWEKRGYINHGVDPIAEYKEQHKEEISKKAVQKSTTESTNTERQLTKDEKALKSWESVKFLAKQKSYQAIENKYTKSAFLNNFSARVETFMTKENLSVSNAVKKAFVDFFDEKGNIVGRELERAQQIGQEKYDAEQQKVAKEKVEKKVETKKTEQVKTGKEKVAEKPQKAVKTNTATKTVVDKQIIKKLQQENNVLENKVENLERELERLQNDFKEKLATTTKKANLEFKENYDGKLRITDNAEAKDITLYQTLRNDALSVESSLRNKPLPREIIKDAPEQYVLVAPLYRAHAESQEHFDVFKRAYGGKFSSRTKNIAGWMGADFNIKDSGGVYKNNDGFFQIEPSHWIALGQISEEKANIIGSLCGDIGFQQQESVIMYNYVGTKAEWDALPNEHKAYCWEIKFNDTMSEADIRKFFADNEISATQVGHTALFLKSYEYDLKGTAEGVEEFNAEITNLVNTLKEEGKVDKDYEIEQYYANERYSGANERQEYYQNFRSLNRRKNKTSVTSSEKNTQVLTTQQANQQANQQTNTPTPVVYKAMETVRDIVEASRDIIEKAIGGSEFSVRFAKNVNDVARKSFKEINETNNTAKEAQAVYDILSKSMVQQFDQATQSYVDVDTVGNIIANPQAVVQAIEQIISTSKDTPARSNATRSFEMEINKMRDTLKTQSFGQSLDNVKQIQRIRDTYKKKVGKKIENDEISRAGLMVLINPVVNLKGKNGYSSKEVANNFKKLLNIYTEENFKQNFPDIPFDAEIRAEIEQIIDACNVPQQQGTRTIYGALTPQALGLIKQYAQDAVKLINDTQTNIVENIKPKVNQTRQALEKMNYGAKTNVFSKLWRGYERSFAPAYVVLDGITGGQSSLRETLIGDVQTGLNGRSLYIGRYSDGINAEMKKNGIKGTDLNKKIIINEQEITIGQAMNLYISLKVQKNFDAINESGIELYDKNNRPVDFAQTGDAQTLKNQVEQKLQDKYKAFADYLLETMNKGVKQDYIKWFESRYGEYNNRNEIGAVGENSYWTLYRSYQQAKNAEKLVKTADALFKRSIKRKHNNNKVLLTDALSVVTSYIDGLANELHVKPAYRNAIAILNAKNEKGTTLYDEIRHRVDAEDMAYLDRTLDSIAGVNNRTTEYTILDRIMSGYSVSILSMNIGSALKQFASVWTSNIPIAKSTKAIWQRAFQDAETKALFGEIVNEIGGIKYREQSNTVALANANELTQLQERIAKVGMTLISKNDLFAIQTGAYSLMVIAKDQYGLKKPSEIKDFVLKNWNDYELSQIGRGALSQNAISRGDYNSIIKAVFGFMQGANRASLGSQIMKMRYWLRNHNVSQSEINANYEKTLAERDTAKQTLTDLNKQYTDNMTEAEIEELDKQVEIAEQDLIQKETAYQDADIKKKDYDRYKIAGGKSIPLQMTAGLIAQGIFVTLITEVMKHIKGKRDWDEWDVKEIATNLGLSISIDWIPFVNTISNFIKGYEVSIPSVELLNKFVDVVNNIKDKDVKGAIREISLTLSKSIGIPVETLYQYLYGLVKTFDAETAWKMNNIFYSSTESSVRNSLIKYADRNTALSKRGANGMMSVLLDNYKVHSSDEVKYELTSLYLDGYSDAIPTSYMTKYEDDVTGESVDMDAKQILVFREEYDKSNKIVEQLIKSTYYKSQTQENRAKMIKSVYGAYYQYAKSKALHIVPTTKLGKVLYLSNGSINISKYVAIIKAVQGITANSTKTRKELVLSYINKSAKLSKAEKILAMYLCGYAPSDANADILVTYLAKSGVNKKLAKELLSMN